MKICPKCHKMYEDSQNFCALDGSRLELSPVSQSMRKEQPTSEETPVIPEKEGKVVEAAEPQGEEKQAEAETEDTFQKEEQEGQKDFQQNQYVPPKPSRGFGQMMEDNFPNQENWKELYLNTRGRVHRGDFVCRWLWLLLAMVLVSYRQWQAAQRSEQQALGGVEFQPGDRGDGLAVQEVRGQLAQAQGARVIQRQQPRAGLANLLPERIVNGRRRAPPAVQQPLDQRNIPGSSRCHLGARVRGITSSLPPPPACCGVAAGTACFGGAGGVWLAKFTAAAGAATRSTSPGA